MRLVNEKSCFIVDARMSKLIKVISPSTQISLCIWSSIIERQIKLRFVCVFPSSH